MNVATRTQSVNQIRELFDWTDTDSEATPRVGVGNPGPPGIGKTFTALSTMIDQQSGRIFEPQHGQAAERKAEIRQILRDQGKQFSAVSALHTQGLARRCAYLPKDEWAKIGWSFGVAACAGCPDRPKCPSQIQHWLPRDITIGVHSMADWAGAGAGRLVIDEMPEPVGTRTYTWDELCQVGRGGWHPTLEGWRRGFSGPWGDLLAEFQILASSFPEPKIWGSTVTLAGIFQKGTPERKSLDACIDYLSNTEMPPPPASSVRSGSLTNKDWIAGDLEPLLRTIRWEADAVPMRDREDQGLAYTACLRVFGDNKGKMVRFQVEHRKRWAPPNASHVVLDSTSHLSEPVYRVLYDRLGFERKMGTNNVTLPEEHIELVHFVTRGFARSRSMTPAGNLKSDGTNARTRALHQVLNKLAQIRRPGVDRPLVGIIDHKGVLEAAGFSFEKEPVLYKDKANREHPAPDERFEEALRDLEVNAELVVGYHGGVIGSNLFKDVRLLVILGDPMGHIEMLAEEARTMGLDAQWYIGWRTETAAYQEVFRARLLDADATNPKLVMYFGAHCPKMPGRTWKVREWVDGGRIPSRLTLVMERSVWRWSGVGERPFFGSLMPELQGLHGTLIDGPLQALRAAGESIEFSSPKSRECYRRGARSAGEELGFDCFMVAHPMGGRRPIPVWARDIETAEWLVEQVRQLLDRKPEWERRQEPKMLQKAVAQRADDDVVITKVDEVRQEVTRLKTERRMALLALKVSASSTGANSAAVALLRRNLCQDYKHLLMDALKDWRVYKRVYKERAKVGRYLVRGLTP